MMLLNSHYSNPVLTGSSVHNQRIERLWRDVFRCVLTVFHQFFHYLEEKGHLNPLSDTDLYCLHVVYVQRINKALKAFANGWNHHAVTTEHSMTPIQLMTVGTLMNPGTVNFQGQPSLTSEDDSVSVPGTVEVPHTPVPLNSNDEAVIEELLTNSAADNGYGIDTYLAVRDYVYSHLDQ